MAASHAQQAQWARYLLAAVQPVPSCHIQRHLASWCEGPEFIGWGAALLLQVSMSPSRPRTLISFEDHFFAEPGCSRPTLTLFEHVEGAKVHRARVLGG